MNSNQKFIIVGGGLAGCLLGWRLHTYNCNLEIWDDSDPFSSSKVAAGVINPISGMRLAKNWKMDEFLPVCHTFYSELAALFDKQFYFPIPIQRMLRNDKEEALVHKRLREPGYSEYLRLSNSTIDGKKVAEVTNAGYLRIDWVIESLKAYFTSKGLWKNQTAPDDLTHSPDSIILYCQGYRAATDNKLTQDLPFKLSRGETVDIQGDLNINTLQNTGKWIMPWNLEKSIYRAGATYEWECLKRPPSDQALEEILEGIAPSIQGKEYRVVAQNVGIRPNTKNNRPIIGQIPGQPNHYIFNGFGSKGVLMIPYCAEQLAGFLTNKLKTLDKEIFLNPEKKEEPKNRPLIQVAQDLVGAKLKVGQIAMDATSGNGHDTSFLAKAVGESGKVFAFDIQKEAIERSQIRLESHNLNRQVLWFNQSHDTLQTVLKENHITHIHACMFNLGFLPKGNPEIITLPDTTSKAVQQAIQVLAPTGIVTILVYVGHPGGNEELKIIEQITQNLPTDDFTTQIIRADVINPKTQPPILFVIEKR
jgi:predicted methyltransferase